MASKSANNRGQLWLVRYGKAVAVIVVKSMFIIVSLSKLRLLILKMLTKKGKITVMREDDAAEPAECHKEKKIAKAEKKLKKKHKEREEKF